jgi:exopolyphosphatase/guanosine-5'-triphosphate,3'-diphosphate pyrophosphatase
MQEGIGIGDTADDFQQAATRIGAVVKTEPTFFEKDVATGTSKTFRTLVKIAITLFPKFGPHLTYSALEAMVPKLQSLDVEGRKAMQSISAERAPQIVAGAMVAKELMRTLNLQEIQICPWALREGIVLHRLDWIER